VKPSGNFPELAIRPAQLVALLVSDCCDRLCSFEEAMGTVEEVIANSRDAHESGTATLMVAELMNRCCATSPSYNLQIMDQASKHAERSLCFFETRSDESGGLVGSDQERFSAMTIKSMNFSTVGSLGPDHQHTCLQCHVEALPLECLMESIPTKLAVGIGRQYSRVRCDSANCRLAFDFAI